MKAAGKRKRKVREMADNKINVMMVDDHTLFRSGLKALLEKEEDIGSVVDTANAEEALEALEQHQVDVVLMDISLPGMDGLEATEHIKEKQPYVKIIVLTMYNDEPYLVKALEANASGYLLKEAASTELISAIRSVMEGEMVIPPSMVKALVSGTIKGKEGGNQGGHGEDPLTEREKEVLRYICLGYTNQEIAGLITVSTKTVEKHKSNIMDKLDVQRRHELVRYAIENKLVNMQDLQE